jgi:Ion channel
MNNGRVWRPLHITERDQHQYGIVLVLILVSLTFQLAAPDREWARLVTIALQGLTLLSALRTSGIHQAVFNVAAIAVAIAVVGAIASSIGTGGIGSTSARIESLLLVGLAPLAIVRGIVMQFREAHRVTIQAMFGVLCIYLLLGMLFGYGFSVINQLDGQDFFASHDSRMPIFLYYSFTTLTTTGYGDFVAATDVGRSLSIAEALIGQIYMVTVVAVIVSNLGRPDPRRDLTP